MREDKMFHKPILMLVSVDIEYYKYK